MSESKEVTEQEFIKILEGSFYDVEGRTKQDRYIEFNKVLMGSNEGRRVLYEILGLARLSRRLVPPFPAPIDTNRMLVLEGARQLAADIIDVITKEPIMDKPVKVNSKQKKS